MAKTQLIIDGTIFEMNIGDGLEITSDGVRSTSDQQTIWTYSGSGTFLGLSTTQGATSPDPGRQVSDQWYISFDDPYYSVASSSDLSISYKGSEIASLSSSGTKILKTAGKYMEDDVEVVYTKPEGADISDTTAVAADVLAPKIFHLSTGASAIGTIPTKSAADATVNQNVVTFPWGYYPSQVQKTVGIAQAAQTITPGSVNQVISSGRYLTGSQTILGDANLLSENIKSGVSIFGKMGTYEGGASTIIDPLSVVANGTYIAPSGHAYSPVSVNIDTQYGWEAVPESWVTGILDRTISGSVYGSMVLQVRSSAFLQCSALNLVSFPKCTTIGNSAFYFCTSLSSVSFPECAYIDNYAFGLCWALTSVSFPECTNINANAFLACTALTSVSFPKCTAIGNSVFESCSALTSVSFPQCTHIGNFAFRACTALTSASFPECIKIEANAFYDCSQLIAISIPKCMFIGPSAFYRCKNLISIGDLQCYRVESSTFYGCSSLISVAFQEVYSIGSCAFGYCTSLEFVSFPKCTHIGPSAFYYCTKLSEISFPECAYIHYSAFMYCSSLRTAYFLGSKVIQMDNTAAFLYTPIYSSIYLGVFGSIYVPSSLVASYKAATNWAYYSSRIDGVQL